MRREERLGRGRVWVLRDLRGKEGGEEGEEEEGEEGGGVEESASAEGGEEGAEEDEDGDEFKSKLGVRRSDVAEEDWSWSRARSGVWFESGVELCDDDKTSGGGVGDSDGGGDNCDVPSGCVDGCDLEGSMFSSSSSKTSLTADSPSASASDSGFDFNSDSLSAAFSSPCLAAASLLRSPAAPDFGLFFLSLSGSRFGGRSDQKIVSSLGCARFVLSCWTVIGSPGL